MSQHAQEPDALRSVRDPLVDEALAAWGMEPGAAGIARDVATPQPVRERIVDEWLSDELLDDQALAAARPLSAEAFTDDAILAPLEPEPPRGWRGVVHRLSGGRISPAPSRAEREWDRLLQRCAAPVGSARRIAVVSRKGGVGKTTTTLMLGHTFAALRSDRVVAIDGNPDAGTLGHRIERQTPLTVGDLLLASDELTTYPDLRRFTSQAPSRLEVLAGDADPHASRAFGGEEYTRVLGALEAHYNLVLLDSGTGVLDSATSGILAAADQLVVVTGSSLDEARAAALTCDWLVEQGHEQAVGDAVVVVTDGYERGRADQARIASHFTRRCRAVHVIPHDVHLEAGGIVDPDLLTPHSQEAWLRVAADVADGFELPSTRGRGRTRSTA